MKSVGVAAGGMRWVVRVQLMTTNGSSSSCRIVFYRYRGIDELRKTRQMLLAFLLRAESVRGEGLYEEDGEAG